MAEKRMRTLSLNCSVVLGIGSLTLMGWDNFAPVVLKVTDKPTVSDLPLLAVRTSSRDGSSLSWGVVNSPDSKSASVISMMVAPGSLPSMVLPCDFSKACLVPE